VNLVLFEPAELDQPLPCGDRRTRHVLEVLRRESGGTFDAGVVNGPRGKATITAITPEGVTFRFEPTAAPAPVAPLTAIIGLPRPQTARDILRDATTLGVAALHFVRTDKGEPNYAQSTLWSSGEWRRHALAGAEQAFDTRVPEIKYGHTLGEALAAIPAHGTRLALDNYEAAQPLSAAVIAPGSAVVLAVGAERGWSAGERTLLRAAGFACVHLGSRVLRAETAVVAALSVVRGKLGLM
jgi:16S rRNA (uracil1498-N3)-methyltransferase